MLQIEVDLQQIHHHLNLQVDLLFVQGDNHLHLHQQWMLLLKKLN
jgi:hypothetical protein